MRPLRRLDALKHRAERGLDEARRKSWMHPSYRAEKRRHLTAIVHERSVVIIGIAAARAISSTNARAGRQATNHPTRARVVKRGEVLGVYGAARKVEKQAL
eukprot:scaffold282160_cov31-Tisochrysis_lutea.AAC.2